MSESNLTDLPEDDDEGSFGVPTIDGRDRAARTGLRLPHESGLKAPVCTDCGLAMGSIKTGTGMVCAGCWMHRMAAFRSDPKRKRRR